MRTSDWLTQQLSELQMRVEESQEKLVRYQKEHGILGIDEKENIITSKLDELNKELTAAEGDRMQKESVYRLGQFRRARSVVESRSVQPLRSS
jgi:succinoglycan biosynthesis transport protein ExoP